MRSAESFLQEWQSLRGLDALLRRLLDHVALAGKEGTSRPEVGTVAPTPPPWQLSIAK